MDNRRTIIKSALSFLSGTLISRITGLLRDISLAYAFGTSAKVATLMVAFRLSNFFRRMLGEGSMQAAFVPHFESLKSKDPAHAAQFFCELKKLFSILLIAIVVISILLFFVINNAFSIKTILNSEWNEIFFLTTLLMPGLFFICLYGLNSALLQCEKFYFIPSIAPVAFNLMWVVGVLSIMHFPLDQAITYLTGFIVLACVGQWALTVPKTNSIIKHYYPVKQQQTLFFSSDVKNFIPPFFMSILGIASTQINSTLDPFFAIYASSSGPAYLWYAIRLEQLPLSLFGIALSSALLPPLSRAIKNNQMKEYVSFLENSLRKTMVFIIPIAFSYFIAGHSFINLLFGRGGFGADSVAATTKCLWGYTFGLIPSCLILILAPGFYAIKSYKTPMNLTIISVLVNIVLNSFFVFYLSMGAEAIAIATGISAWVNCIFLSLALKKEVEISISEKTWIVLFATPVLSFVASFLSVITEFFVFKQVSSFEIIREGTASFPMEMSSQVLYLLVQALPFAIAILPLWIYEIRTDKNLEECRE